MNESCSKLFQSSGIIHPRTCIYIPQQNGIAKRKHRHVLVIARAIRFQGRIPLRFWGHCVLAAMYVINRLSSSVLAGKSLFGVIHKKKPNIEHIRIIGCLCFAKRMNVHDKFDARATAADLMVYSEVTKGYILYDYLSTVSL